MAVRVNVPQRQGGRGLQINPIQARGRQLQSAAPTAPKNSFQNAAAQIEKTIDGYIDFDKESRQKANRAKLVQSLVARVMTQQKQMRLMGQPTLRLQ
jgi:hypothetical protein